MRIALNAAFAGSTAGYVQQLAQLLCGGEEHDEVTIISNASLPFQLPASCTPIITGHKVQQLMRRRFWLDLTLPRVLNRVNPGLCISFNNMVSLRCPVPQLWCIDDMLFHFVPREQTRAERLFIRFYLKKYLSKAGAVVVPSVHFKTVLADYYRFPAEMVFVVPKFPVQQPRKFEWEEKEKTTERLTGGTEYFLFPAGFSQGKNLLNVLKAFSRFKKWQRSDMKLVITGDFSNPGTLLQKINTYRYREDLVIARDTDERAAALASAYAVVYPPLYDDAALPVIEAMHCGVPVITANSGATADAGGGAVLYADPADDESIAVEMIRIYREEESRNRYIALGLEQAKKFSREASQQKLQEAILKASSAKT